MELKGIIERIEETNQVTEKFRKREFVLKVMDGEYEQFISLECHQDKCDDLDKFSVGTELSVEFNLRGRNWTNPEGAVRTFNTLQAWRLTGEEATKAKTSAEGDDLPF